LLSSSSHSRPFHSIFHSYLQTVERDHGRNNATATTTTTTTPTGTVVVVVVNTAQATDNDYDEY
jgi:hypothetical protein